MDNSAGRIQKLLNSRNVNIILLTIFAVGISSYIFRSHIGLLIWALRCKSPVVWNNVKVTFPKGVIYKKYDKSIQFFYWEDPSAFLYIRKIDLNTNTKDYLIRFFTTKNFHILETTDMTFKNYDSFTISYLDNPSKVYNEGIYVIPKNICILFEGDKEKYSELRGLIDHIEFL